MGLLTPQDGEILRKAIREALPRPAPPPPKPSFWRGVLRLLVAIVVGFLIALIVWAVLGWLLGTHVPLRTHAISGDPTQVTHLSMSKGMSKGQGWTTEQISTDRLTVLAPNANLGISVPVRVADCLDLSVPCADGVITTIALPAELRFSTEVSVTVTSAPYRRFDISRLVDANEPDNLVLGFLTDEARVDLSITVEEPTMLTVTSADGQLGQIELDPANGGLPDDRRVRLEFRSGENQTNLVLEHITTIQELTAPGRSSTVVGFVGKVVITDSGTTLVDPATTLSISGDGSDDHPVVARISMASSSVFELSADPAISVKTDEGELLPSKYAHRPQIWGPFIAALMGGLVLELTVGQLGTFLKGLLDRVGKLGGAG